MFIFLSIMVVNFIEKLNFKIKLHKILINVKFSSNTKNRNTIEKKPI